MDLILVVAVHEHVSLGRMPVEVAVEEYVSAFKSLLHHELGVVEDWILLAAGPNPLSVKVLPDKGAPIISDNHAVRVKHRDYLKHECIPEEVCLLFVADEVFYDAIHND